MKTITLIASALLGIAAPVAAQEANARPDLDPDRSVMGSVILSTNHMDKTKEFYSLLGFEEVLSSGEAPKRFVTYNITGRAAMFEGGIALYETTEPLVQGNSYLRTIVVVKDLRAACKRLAEADMPCTHEPEVSPSHDNALEARAEDPDGRRVDLFEPRH